MPLPQVNDRLKELPAQALRTLFATIGQLLLAADRLRARTAEQLSGSGGATAAPPSDQAPATPPPPPPPPVTATATPAVKDAASSRWRSLDRTGNVRLIDGTEEQEEEEFAAPAAPASFVAEPQPTDPAVPAPAIPAEYTPTEPVPAVPAPADLAVPQPADPAVPAPADLPVPHYDQASVASLRARLRVLDAAQVQVLLDYEKAHEGRPAVITMFERRLAKLSEGS